MGLRSTGLAPKLASIVLLTVGSVAFVLDRVAENRLAAELTREFESKGEAIALSLAYALAQNSRETLAGSVPRIQESIDSGRTIDGVSYLYIQDWEGSILVHTFEPTFPPSYVETNWIAPGELPEGKRVKVARNVHIETVNGAIDAIDVAAPIAHGELGVVHVGMDRTFIVRQVSGLRRSMAWLSGLIAIVGVALGLVFSFVAIVRPIRALGATALEIVRTGDLRNEVAFEGRDEIGDLIGSFNRMIVDLRRSREEVAESNRELARRTREAEQRSSDLERANVELASKERELDLKNQELDLKNQELLRASRAKSQFLTSMSHELRTPMNSIIGFTDLALVKSTGLEPKHRANLERVLGNANHLLALINNVLDLAKVEAGKMELSSETIDLAALLESAATMSEVLLQGKPVKLVRRFEPLPTTRGDPTRLRQIALNLLSNACKFTRSGEVRLYAGVRDGAVTITVEDTGTGMTAEDAATLFEDFRQVGSLGGRGQGTGLGLSISKRMVDLMGGTIDVETQLGVGSLFTVRFPITPGANELILGRRSERDVSPISTPRRPTLPPTREVPILVVTDDPDSVVAVREALKGRAYEVHASFSAEEAVRLAVPIRPAAILVRLSMDDPFGWNALRMLKAHPDASRIPAMLISVSAGRVTGLRLPDGEYLDKQVERATLLATVQRVGGREILIVDDDPSVHEIVGDALVRGGFVVRHADGGRAALEECRARPPDLVLLDLLMPEVDGFEVVRTLRSEPTTATLPVVVLTNRDLLPREHEVLRSTVERVFQKSSLTGDALIRELAEVLGSSSAAATSSARAT